MPPAALREAREFLRYRISRVGVRTIIKNWLISVLARRNLQPQCARRWTTVTGLRELQTFPLTGSPDVIGQHCVSALRLLDEHIRALDRELTLIGNC